MNSFQRNLINELAEDIIRMYNIKIPITNIEDVVEKLGGRIEIGNADFNLMDGSIQKVNESFTISLTQSQNYNRKNFTVAHELGHLFLHMGYMIDEELWEQQDSQSYYRSGNSELEYQANEFASALLMPRSEYKRIMDQNTTGNTVDTARVAEYFNVSISAASNRGKWLGYLQW